LVLSIWPIQFYWCVATSILSWLMERSWGLGQSDQPNNMIMLKLGIELAKSQSIVHVSSSSVRPNRLANASLPFTGWPASAIKLQTADFHHWMAVQDQYMQYRNNRIKMPIVQVLCFA